jgi:aminopeptidase N
MFCGSKGSSMHFGRQTTEVTASALIFLLLLTCFSASSIAQRPARRRQIAPAVPSPRRQLQGPTHPRPPRAYDVLHYTLHTRFDFASKAVIGDETVTIKPLVPNLKVVELDASDMTVQTVTLAATNASLRWTQPPNKLSIILDRPHNSNDVVPLHIGYQATPRRGLYFIPAAGDPGGATSKPAQIWTQGEPEDNHHWFPCYDFPDSKATSEQYITTGANQIAISNGALVETSNNADGSHTFHWKMDRPHASYLISLIVGDYVKLSDSYKNIAVEYYTYHGTETGARRAFYRTPEMIKWFSQELGYEYPYGRYAQTIVAHFTFGGMENITATTHSDTEILSTDDDGSSAENLVSHELAHQWFGDLVTCKTWSQAWLNEGFASFMEASFKEHERGHDAYLKEIRDDALIYFSEDALRYRRPLVYDHYQAPIDLFDATLYKKGALVVHMLRETVGDDMFWRALNRYLNDNKDGDVETADLERAFEKTTGKDLKWFFEQWVYKAGYPELTTSYSYDAVSKQVSVDVEQTQTPDATTPAVFRLPLDIELVTAEGARTETVDVTQRKQRFSFPLSGKPLAVNFDKEVKLLKKINVPQPAAPSTEIARD